MTRTDEGTQNVSRGTHPTILGLGTAVPDRVQRQEDTIPLLADRLGLHGTRRTWYDRVSRGTTIETRHAAEVIQPDLRPAERQAIYGRVAPALGESAARTALADAGLGPGDITHMVTVTCTSAVSPGLDILIAQALGCAADVQRLGVNFAGCHGAFKGLAAAAGCIAEDPDARVLLCCVELCSLHLHPTRAPDQLIASALFADGAAAVVLAAADHAPASSYAVTRRRSLLLPDTLMEMRWDQGDYCSEMRLTAAVADYVEAHVADFVDALRPAHVDLDDCAWAVHPGGPRVLEAVERACALDSDALSVSWNVLRSHGNMSSPTVLFVIDQIRRQRNAAPCILALGFGPGLTFEGAVLERIPKAS